MNKYSFLFLRTNISTNFKPRTNISHNFLKIKKTEEQIFCKNFFVFILLIKYQNSIFNKSNIFIKKYKKKVFTILRSPYRHKLARHQMHLSSYNIVSSLKLKINNIEIKNWNNLLIYLIFIKKSNKFFESNLISSNNIRISMPFSFKWNFLLSNFI